jgi:hypothetical protein
VRTKLVGVLSSLAILAGCGYDTGSDLPGVVSDVTPPGARLLTRCTGASGLIDSPSHSCTFFARGDGGSVTTAVAQALREQGFEVACRAPGEITAVGEDVRVLVEVAQHGSVVVGNGVVNVFSSGYRPRGSRPIPAGSVALEIGASRLEAASASFWRSLARERGECGATLPKPNLAEHCVNWWNNVGRPTAAKTLRLQAGPEVQIRADWGVGRSACTYTLGTPAGYRRVKARFVHGDWIWPRLRKVRVVGFRPNALMNEDGRIGLAR